MCFSLDQLLVPKKSLWPCKHFNIQNKEAKDEIDEIMLQSS